MYSKLLPFERIHRRLSHKLKKKKINNNKSQSLAISVRRLQLLQLKYQMFIMNSAKIKKTKYFQIRQHKAPQKTTLRIKSLLLLRLLMLLFENQRFFGSILLQFSCKQNSIKSISQLNLNLCASIETNRLG